jgi:chaperone required for assembly of F1-ATPase
MLKTIRTLTESKLSNKTINEQSEPITPLINKTEEEQNDDITVINDVDVKLVSSDESDMKLSDQQKGGISQIIDGFRQQVSQIVDFHPGFTITQNQIRLDGSITELDIDFVFIAGDESGIYINADMLKLEQDTATMLEKLAKFEETYKTSMDPLITYRKNN